VIEYDLTFLKHKSIINLLPGTMTGAPKKSNNQTSMTELYETLKVPKTAAAATIRKSFNKVSSSFHFYPCLR